MVSICERLVGEGTESQLYPALFQPHPPASFSRFRAAKCSIVSGRPLLDLQVSVCARVVPYHRVPPLIAFMRSLSVYLCILLVVGYPPLQVWFRFCISLSQERVQPRFSPSQLSRSLFAPCTGLLPGHFLSHLPSSHPKLNFPRMYAVLAVQYVQAPCRRQRDGRRPQLPTLPRARVMRGEDCDPRACFVDGLSCVGGHFLRGRIRVCLGRVSVSLPDCMFE